MPKLSFRVVAPWLAALFTFASPALLSAQARPLSPRWTATQNGDVEQIGNTVVTCTSSVSCGQAQAGQGVGRAADNDGHFMRYVDIDGDPSTFNSSDATLSIPSGATVAWAGLYWGARTNPGGGGGVTTPNPTLRGQLLLRAPGAVAYTTVTAQQFDQINTDYAGFADVTALVRAGGSGSYRVANLQAATGRQAFGGWALVVAYSDPSLPRRYISVQDGLGQPFPGGPISVAFSGFRAAPVAPVAASVGYVFFDGDRFYTGDRVALDGQVLSDGQNPAGGQFNGSISRRGVRVTAKRPDYINQLGFDLDLFQADGIVQPGATGARIDLDSPGDETFVHAVTFVVDVEPPPVPATADVVTTKTGPATIQPGGTIVYTIVVRNQGPDPAANVVVEDSLPASGTFISASGGGTMANGVVRWPVIASLASGATQAYTVSFQAPGSGALLNVAASTAATPDADPANNDGSAPAARVTTVVAVVADVQVTKTGPTTITNETQITYTVTVRNGGPATASAVVVTDTLPSGAGFVSASAGGSVANGVVTWPTIAQLLAGGSMSFTVSIVPPAANQFTNVAAATSSTPDPDITNNRTILTTSRAPIGIALSADLAVTKTGPATVLAGGAIAYSIVVRNDGPDPAVNVLVSDTLPAGVTFVSASGGGVVTSGVVTWPVIPVLANGASQAYTLTVTAPATGPASLTNIAAAVSPTPDPDLSNNNGSASTSRVVTGVVTMADVVTSKTGPATVAAGATFTYAVTVRNDGSDAAANVVVTDTLPGVVTFVSATGGATISGGVLTWPTIPTLAAGASQSWTVTVVAPTAGTFTNVVASTSPTPDPEPANNDGSAPNGRVTTTVAAQADIEAIKSGPANVDPFGAVSYTITLRNLGPSVAVNVVLIDSLPAGTAFVSATGGASLAGRVLTWPAIASLAVGEPVVYTVVVTAPLQGSFTNVVAATADTPDPDPTNNNGTRPAARPITTVRPIDVAIAKSHVGDFMVGTVAEYAITVTNVGPTPTVGPLTVVDTIPAGLAVEGATGAGWSCTVAGAVVTCSYAATLAPTQTAAFDVSVRVLAGVPPNVVNRAIVSTPGDEEPVGNNVAEDSARVLAMSPLVLEKRVLRQEVEAGDLVDYQLLVSNVATRPVPGVVVTDTLPFGFTLVSRTVRRDGVAVPDPEGAPGPVLKIDVGTLAANGTVVLSYRLLVGAGAPAGPGENRAFARSIPTGVESPLARTRVRFRAGLLSDRGFIVGRVAAQYDSADTRRELGIPGVRVILSDGTSAITDEEGKYSFYGLAPTLHIVRVDETTLPETLVLAVSNARQAGEARSRFVDLQNGELHRADFFARDVTPAQLEVIRERHLGFVPGVMRETAPDTVLPARNVADRAGPSGVAADRADSAAIRGVYRALAPDLNSSTADRRTGVAVSLAEPAASVHEPGRSPIELGVPAEPVPADGQTIVAVRVRLLDAAVGSRRRVTLESTVGRWQVADQDSVEPGVQVTIEGTDGTFGLVAPDRDGLAEIRVTSSGVGQVASIAFVPAERPLIAVGLVQGRIDLRSLTRGALAPALPNDGFEQELRDLATSSDDGLDRAAARGALFLRGKVQGKYLLTLAYDSERDPERQLFRDIRPEEFYPVYGDASIREYDAQSFERLYVRVDRDRNFFLYGDYATTSPTEARELGAYLRTLTGAVQRIENEHMQATVFASRDRNRQVVDEIRGRGISGPYGLSRSDGRVNSERVELVTRDRNQPARILRLEPQRRYLDYSMEPFTGRLLFRRPVPSVDGDLNPVSIRVSYELERDGESQWVVGGDAQFRLGAVELGGSAVHEDDPLGSYRLWSLNGTVKLGAATTVLAEWARTDGDAREAGDAGRVELRHSSKALEAYAFAAQSDSSFDNRSSTFGGGRRELGAQASLRLDERTRLVGHAIRTEDRRTDGRRDGALLAVERALTPDVRAEVGYRYGSETGVPADTLIGTAVPNETNAIHGRLTVDFGDSLQTGLRRGSLFAEYDQDVQQSDQRRGSVGGHYQLFPRLRAYGRHEFLSSFAGPFALNGDQRTQATVIGFDGGYGEAGQVFSEYRLRDGLAGRDGEAVIGLRNRWTVARGLRLDASFERIHPTSGSAAGRSDATSIAGAVEYTTSPDWRGTARLEFRDAADGDSWLATLGYARKLTDDWTMLGRVLWNALDDDQVRTHGQFGLAWRQTTRGTWNGLARYERRFERLGFDGAGRTTRGASLLSAHLNWQASSELVVSGRWTGKWASDSAFGVETSSRAHVAMLRAVQDLGPSWDIGAQAGVLSVGSGGGRRFGLGGEIGRRLIDNLRLALGYNVFGFRDRDIRDTDYTLRGLYLRLDFKFDEGLLGANRDR